MIRRIINSCGLLLLTLLPAFIQAQHFTHAAPLDTVKQTGFYRILLSPSITSLLKPDFSNLRLLDAKNQQVPYVLSKSNKDLPETDFHTLKILENKQGDSGNTILLLQNTGNDSITNIRLQMKNAAVSRTAILSGSNDQQHWYIIQNELRIAHAPGTGTDEMTQELILPQTRYTYFRLVIDNRRNDPYLITGAGFDKKRNNYYPMPETVNPMPAVSQTDSARQSFLHLYWDQPLHHNRIVFQATGTRFFDRDLVLYEAKTDSVRNSGPGAIIGHFRLISGPSKQVISLPTLKSAQLYMVIENGDNPPLKITDVTTRQETKEAIAYLEKDMRYRILTGDAVLTAPNYDLERFRDSLPSSIPYLGYGSIESIGIPEATNPEKSRQWLWPVIIGVILLLAGLSYRLLQDLKKRTE